MPLTSIVTICLRIFALNWLIYGIIGLVDFFGRWRQFRGEAFGYSLVLSVLVPVVGAILVWMWSRTIARAVTPRPDSTVQLGGLTSLDLYAFAFTFLGAYFFLTSIPPLINLLHYSLVEAGKDPVTPASRQTFYDFTHYIVTLIIGGACVLFAPRFARKLTNAHQKEQALVIAAKGGDPN